MITVLEALNAALHEAMEQDERVVFLGEDVLDPYGGAFKVARGLSTRFPDRVLTTPISEMAIIGIASGMALRGLRPVTEIMFGDFLTLACDQLLNHACKYRWMYNNQVRVPMVVRTPMGGYRGYGPTHSQSIEKHFLGILGLRVVAPNALSDAKQLLLNCVFKSEDPTLFVEHKLLYTTPLKKTADVNHVQITAEPGLYPTTVVRVTAAPDPVATVAAYGYTAEMALEAVWRLAMEQEIFAELIVPTLIHPMDLMPLLSSVRRTKRLVTVEESCVSFGWGSEVVSKTVEIEPCIVRRVGAQNSCIPSSRPLESAVLPSIEDICDAVMQIIESGSAGSVR
jgi:pyruvate/2-oxoglutarate/acetoin dehydrogenase E1 component